MLDYVGCLQNPFLTTLLLMHLAMCLCSDSFPTSNYEYMSKLFRLVQAEEELEEIISKLETFALKESVRSRLRARDPEIKVIPTGCCCAGCTTSTHRCRRMERLAYMYNKGAPQNCKVQPDLW